jgi:hypothetical protein
MFRDNEKGTWNMSSDRRYNFRKQTGDEERRRVFLKCSDIKRELQRVWKKKHK